jgi:hypothetical protein
MNNHNDNDTPVPPSANVFPIRRQVVVEPHLPLADDVGRRILENDDLVQLILDSEKIVTPPMTIEEFKAWLDRLDDPPPIST